MTKYLNLIRKVTWSFHQTTGIEWNELFSEASLAYCESLQSYDPSKQIKESSWIYICVQNQLKNFCKNELRNYSIEHIGFWNEAWEVPEYEYYETDRFKNLSKDTRAIISMVLKNPEDYATPGGTSKAVFGILRHNLNHIKGWNWSRVDKSLKVLRLELMTVSS